MNESSKINEQGILWFKSGNYEKAKECWVNAAEQGNSSAMFCLGVLYLSTRYYNLPLAKLWFEKANIAGHKNAKYQLEHLKDGAARTEVADRIFYQSPSVYNNVSWKEVKFGNYEWFVLEEQQQKELYVSKYIIDIRKYNSSAMHNVSWETSDIRRWLNSDFFDEFLKDEKELICNTCNANKGNPKYKSVDESTTIDRIFLLSYEELIKYMLKSVDVYESPDLLSNNNNFIQLVAMVNMSDTKIVEAQERSGLDYSMMNGQSIGWWLRTLGETSDRAMRVNCNGAIRLHGREICRNLVGVRPAMWVMKHDK